MWSLSSVCPGHFPGSERRSSRLSCLRGLLFTHFVNSGVSGGRWTLTRWPRSSMLSLTLEWTTVTPPWPVHQGQYSGCWMLLRVLSPALGSLIAVLVRYCTTNCIGSTSPTGFSSSLQWQFTSVWTAAHHRICQSTASLSPVLTRGGICVPPTVTYLPYRVSGSTLSAVGRSRLLARWPGTLSRILSWMQRAAQTVLGVYLKRICSHNTSASSALGVLNDYALYKSTHSVTHSWLSWA